MKRIVEKEMCKRKRTKENKKKNSEIKTKRKKRYSKQLMGFKRKISGKNN